MLRGGKAENCLVTHNRSDGRSGGIDSTETGYFRHCTVCDNQAAIGGGVWLDGSVTGFNSVVYFNTATTSDDNWGTNSTSVTFHHCVTTPLPGGTGCSSADPRFMERAVGNYRLAYASPCIDAGSAEGPELNIDLRGWPRPEDGDLESGAAYDMGAYEYMPQAEDSDGDQLTDADEVLLHFSSPTNVNTDGDPVGDWEEAYADTSLTNPTSYFRISGISNDPMRVYWQSSSNRLYSLTRTITSPPASGRPCRARPTYPAAAAPITSTSPTRPPARASTGSTSCRSRAVRAGAGPQNAVNSLGNSSNMIVRTTVKTWIGRENRRVS